MPKRKKKVIRKGEGSYMNLEKDYREKKRDFIWRRREGYWEKERKLPEG